MDVFWLQQTEADVPPDNDWLSAYELSCLSALRFPKRRADWRLGRWTAKHALALHLGMGSDRQALANTEIRAAASGAPEAFIANWPANAAISISHCNGNSICAIAPPGTALGCDLELVEPRSKAFTTDYFAPAEQALVADTTAADRDTLITLLWNAKESALKALHQGLRLDTRSVVVTLPDSLIPLTHHQYTITNPGGAVQEDLSGWRTLEVSCPSCRIFHGWWRKCNNLLLSLVADPAAESPIALAQ